MRCFITALSSSLLLVQLFHEMLHETVSDTAQIELVVCGTTVL